MNNSNNFNILNNFMYSSNRDYNNAFYSSPQIPLAKYECSPIVTIEKYKVMNLRLITDGIVSGVKNNTSHLINFPNQVTPMFKEINDRDRNRETFAANSFGEKNGNNISSETSNNKIKNPLNLNTSSNLIGNYIERQGNGNTYKGTSFLPNVFSSLRRYDKDLALNNYLSRGHDRDDSQCVRKKLDYYRHEKDVKMIMKMAPPRGHSFLNRKTKNSSRRNSIEQYMTKLFRIDEIIIDGKKINFLLNEDLFDGLSNISNNSQKIDSFYSQEVIKPFYDNNFKRFNNINKNETSYSSSSRGSPKSPKNPKSPSKKNQVLVNKISHLIDSAQFRKIFLRQMKKSTLPINSLTPLKLFKEKIENLKNSFTAMQNDYISRSRKILNYDLFSQVAKHLNELNLLCDSLVDCASELNKTTSKRNKKKNRNYSQENYDCTICHRSFDTGQGLGGHMSRMHPNCSVQYKIKMKVRKSRSKERQLLQEAKKRLLTEYNYDYSTLIAIGEKKLIKKILFEHRREYKDIQLQLKKEKQIK
jgi:hypothetical protein